MLWLFYLSFNVFTSSQVRLDRVEIAKSCVTQDTFKLWNHLPPNLPQNYDMMIPLVPLVTCASQTLARCLVILNVSLKYKKNKNVCSNSDIKYTALCCYDIRHIPQPITYIVLRREKRNEIINSHHGNRVHNRRVYSHTLCRRAVRHDGLCNIKVQKKVRSTQLR